MIIYMDENMPLHLAQGFQLLQQLEGLRTNYEVELRHWNDVFDRDVADEVWIAQLGKSNACIITQDINLSYRHKTLALYQAFGIGVFFLKSPSQKKGHNVWAMVQALAKNWEEICQIVHEEKRPFGYVFSLHRGMKKLE